MNQARKRTGMKKVLSMILVLVMLLSLLSMAAFTLPTAASSDSAASNDDSFYRIVHLDCGRKYFTKDWIIALLNEMKADGYNQLQLAFGNDGLRFLLDDMSFTANGKTYSHDTVVSKVKAGNIAQNSSGDEHWLTKSEMDEIIATAQTLGIEIVPLLNLPGHANAILDIADDKYNASGSNNTLNVASSEEARNFGMAIFKKYVDYFASKGCKFFSFGADEYANDASGTFSFSRLDSTQYATFVGFINSLAAYIESKGMTPRAFNDGLYYNEQKASIDTEIQCCYWSPGWNGYNLASASAIANKHAMINTNGDYYYILGKDDKFDSGYSYAANFKDTTFPTYNQWTGTWGTETVSNPVGSMFCIWSDFPDAETETQVAQKVRLPMRAMALRMNDQSIDGMDTSVVANGFKADGTLNTGSTGGSETENVVNITVAVGGTFEKTVSGANYARDEGYTTADETVASVVVNGEDATKSEPIYDSVDVSYSTLAGNNSAWSKTNYYYKDGDEYCPVYAYKQTEGKLWWATTTYHYGYMPDGETAVKEIGNATENSTVKVYEYKGIKEGTPASTTITFTGHKVGDTSVTIGGVTYKIHVTAEDLSKVTPLTIEYWITNGPVLKDKNSSTTAVSVSATKEIATETGVSVAALVPGSGIKESEKNEANAHTLEYWQAKLLNKSKPNNSSNGTEEQTTKDGDDETLSGSAFTKVRYWGGTWQVYTTEWVTVKSTDQLVAYYMEVINITNKNNVENLHVNAADWGLKGDGSTALGYNPGATCSVSVQLVYEDGSTSPSATTAAELKSKTIVYSYWNDGRGLGTMVFNGKDNYQIFKVTAETGDMSSTTSSRNTVTVDSFTWDNNEETVWEGAATDSVSIGNPVKNPSYDAPYDNLAWNTSEHNENNAILIRVYVKSIPKAGALTVNYFVQGNADPFYHYGINVVENTTFDAGFKRVEDADAPGKARLINNSVTNYDGEQQEVQSDLSKMTEIGAQYRYSDYKFVEATRSEDGKTVNLYYTFKAEKTFVIDFGLPLVIRPADVQSGFEGVTFTQVDVTKKSTYANITVDASGTITYTLNQPIDGADTFGVQYSGYRGTGSGGHVTYTITVIPATSVYYEDSFASFTNGTGKAADAKWSIVGNDGNVTEDKSTSKNQALTELGKMDADAVYGHDAAYADSTKLSMGSARKVTVTSDMYEKGDTTTTWPTATFTFKGTGFDVISLTDNNSGMISVKVYAVGGDGTETLEKTKYVNNYYGYVFKDGVWTVNNSANNALYQIPVIKVDDLAYGTHKVVITTAYASYADKNGDGQYSFWLDAIRVYDPMGKDNDTYMQDNEGYPQYIKLHDAIVGKTAGIKNAVFVDGGVNAKLDQYKDYGPNNEVYLTANQAISFRLTGDLDSIASVQIGAKTPNGTGDVAKISVNGQEVKTATEMYYAITKYAKDGQQVTIANNGSGILSLTNLKITYKESGKSVSLAALTTADQENAVAQVRALFAAPEQTFEPEHFTAKWSRNVRKGGTATLTVKASADVEAITVNGEKITVYTTKTARSFWGSKETYHVFTYRVTNAATADYTVCALNADGVASDPITATLTVRPSIRDWWNGIFDKWKH